MNTSTLHGSAKIYEFPTRLRTAIVPNHEKPASTVELQSQRTCDVAFGSWYHEAAVQQSEQGQKSR